jgi:NADPH:quinone reductase-like Zn-dependent oxidoreductase
MWRHGGYIELANLPARLGYEAAGTVDALGEGVAGFTIGEPVNVIPNFSINPVRDLWRADGHAGLRDRCRPNTMF